MKLMKDDLHHMILFNHDELDTLITAFKRAINTWSPAPEKIVKIIEELEDARLRL
jgi:hypothetical protein|tara:strand:+ start:568 stop:732 length:165 start_codon:yes stop_codon:yes gene_type:complete